MKKRIDNYIIIVLVIIVTINLFLFSSISPLNSIYNMQYDEWIFYLIGKGMVHGKIPYHDLMDHKGPYLFYLFALMNLFPRNHIGLFIVFGMFFSNLNSILTIICVLVVSRCHPASGNMFIY